MYNIKKITKDLIWVGANDRRIALFEGVYHAPQGVSYNSYLLMDDKTVLLDTVDKAVTHQFMENIENSLGGRNLDYLIINHMEPDHCAEIPTILQKYPTVKIVCNAKIQAMIGQFFDFEIPQEQYLIVKEGDVLNTGKHNLTFIMAPMVHWPEVMVTYDSTDKILFSADAFGSFGAIDGNIFADEVDWENRYLDEARRYYTNIVGKYGPQVQMLLKKASGVEINMVCPLHGYVWRKDLDKFIDKYQKWSTYTPEINSVLIAYASVYGGTQNAAEILASKLAELGVKDIKMFDVSVTHSSYVVSDAFKYSHIVFASTTYNNGIFVEMENLLHDIVAHNLQNRKFAVIENGSWAPQAGRLMTELLSQLKNNEFIGAGISIKSAVKSDKIEEIENLAKAIVDTMK
ncbi:MAG: FprA family A-type flavoprotein [Cyanobacteria bacterium SIG26]|nr:FprA family A-type flavoprotein [Cyanobacteria bacterium SIG26]